MKAPRLRPSAIAIATGAACNAAFELPETQLPPPDAPYSCPTAAPPRFTGIAIEEFAQTCLDYTFSARANLAVGYCFLPTKGFRISSGPLASPLELVELFDSATVYYRFPRPSPDGERLYVQRNTDPALLRSRRVGATWVDDGPLAIPHGLPSTVAIGANQGDLLLVSDSTMLREWEVDASGTPTERLPAHDLRSELGVDSLQDFALSVDGLRVTLIGALVGGSDNRVLYTWRDSLAARFRPAQPLVGVPLSESSVFMTDDCARVYVSGLGRLFYVLQQ